MGTGQTRLSHSGGGRYDSGCSRLMWTRRVAVTVDKTKSRVGDVGDGSEAG